VRLNVPSTDHAEVDAVAEVLASGFLTQGPRTAQFEHLVKEYTGARHAFATSSATTALHLSLHAMGVGPGDEVVIPDFSFPATANVVVQLGAVPVFVDIDLATYNLDPALLDEAITDRTKAIMPVHAFGLTADMDAISAVADAHGLPTLEDAACAIAGEYHGRKTGTLGTAAAYSFHPRKIITTGEGGMVLTDDEEIARRVTVLRSHGGVRGELYMDFVDAGYNYRLSDVHGAIGVAQMAKLEGIVAERRRLAAELDARLAGLDDLSTPFIPDGVVPTYQSYVVLLDDHIDRDQVIRELARRDIESTLGTYSMHLQPYFAERFGIPDAALPNATRAHRQALTLPLYPGLRDSDLDRIAEELGGVVRDSAVRRS
jgi:perosamine synthetase